MKFKVASEILAGYGIIPSVLATLKITGYHANENAADNHWASYENKKVGTIHSLALIFDEVIKES